MTEDQILNAFYSDIKEEHTDPWKDVKALAGKEIKMSCKEIFEMFPEPVREEAYLDNRGMDLNIIMNLRDIFNEAFNWTHSKHGKFWRAMYLYFDQFNSRFGSEVSFPDWSKYD